MKLFLLISAKKIETVIFYSDNYLWKVGIQKDIYFEKDNTAFSEEIEIKRGHDLANEFPKKNDFFLKQWVNGITSSVETEFVLIK